MGPMLALLQRDLEGVYPVFTPRLDEVNRADIRFSRIVYRAWKIP
jgi:hypothetical protein